MGVIIIMPLIAALSIICRRRFEESAPLSVFLVILLIYLSGLVTTFLPGFYLALAMCAAGFIVCVKALLTGKGRQDLRTYVFTPGFAAYIAVLIFMFLVSFGRTFTTGDDYKHWALAVKNYCYFNDFSNVPGAVDVYTSYQPASTIFEYWNTKLWTNCSQGMMLVGIGVMTLSLLLPFMRFVSTAGTVRQDSGKKGRRARWWGLLLFIFALPLFTQGMTYTSLLVDTLMGYESAYILLQYYRYREGGGRFYIVTYLLGLAVLSLTKEFGMILSGMILLCVLWNEITLRRRGLAGKKEVARALRIFLACGVLTVLFGVVSWYGYLSIPQTGAVPAQADTGALLQTYAASRGEAAYVTSKGTVTSAAGAQVLTGAGHLGEIFSFLAGKGDLDLNYVRTIASTFIKGLFSTESGYSFGYLLPCSYAVFIGAAVLFWCVRERRHPAAVSAVVSNADGTRHTAHGDREGRELSGGAENMAAAKKAFSTSQVLYIGWIVTSALYLLCLLASYILLFPPREAAYLGALNKYLSSLVAPTILLGVWMVLEDFDGKVPVHILYGSIAVILFVTVNLSGLTGAILDRPEEVVFAGIDHNEDQGGLTFHPGERIYYIDTDDAQRELNMKARFGYRVFPAYCNQGGANIFDNYVFYGSRVKSGEDPEKAFAEMLQQDNYSYVYLQTVNDRFRNELSGVFDSPSDIGDDQLYQIEWKSDGSVKLHLIYA
ncbi:MAG: hypothetical protein PUC46_00730 [Lachnospiraceae bacterium]|nr:hypothetical protein [Lachnospiraceae bacterium]